jgi:hypothetical protein
MSSLWYKNVQGRVFSSSAMGKEEQKKNIGVRQVHT